MRWRRRWSEVGERPERTFVGDVVRETVKEGAITLVDRAGAAGGAVVGLVAGNLGAPATASVVAGTIAGSTITVVGKAVVTVSMDRWREWRAVAAVNDLRASVLEVIDRIDTALTRLTGVGDEMKDSQARIGTVLKGAHAEVLGGMNGGMAGARALVADSSGALRQARDELRSYLSTI
jgi:hypothetical protein